MIPTVALSDLVPLLPAMVLVVTGIAILLLRAFSGRGESPPYAAVSLVGILAALAVELLRPAQAACCNCGLPRGLAASIAGDGFAHLFSVVILAVGVGVALLSQSYGRVSGTPRAENEALTLFALAGMLGLVSSVDLIALFLALEIASVALYALCGLRRERAESQEAALKYFVTGAFSSAFLLFGIALLYGVTGKTTLAGVAAAISTPASSLPALVTAVGLILVGLAFKVASVPFHMWAPDVYQGAPTTTTALMAAAVKTAAFGAMLRILLVGLGPLATEWQGVVAILAVLTMIGGNLGALAQSNLKRMLAYSSIAHAGYMLTALVAAPRVAAEAVAFYLVGYAAVSVGAFGALAALAREGQEPATLTDVAGLGARRPALAAAITVFMISLTGIPVSAGFVGKFQLFRAAIAGGWTVLALVGVLMSVVSAYYYLRVVVAMYMRAPEGEDGWARVAIPARLALGVAALTVLWLGVLPASALSWARTAAAALLP